MTRKHLIEIISFLYILLFVYAAVAKLIDYEKFVIQISQSTMLFQWAVILSWFVPAIELVIVVLLLFDHTRIYGLHTALLLMVMFTTYIVLVSKYSEFVPCSCGGVLEKMTWNQHLVFNFAFILLAMAGIVLSEKRKSISIESDF